MSVLLDVADEIANEINQIVQSRLRQLVTWKSICDLRNDSASVALKVREEGLPSVAELIIRCSKSEENPDNFYTDVLARAEIDENQLQELEPENIEGMIRKYKAARPTMVTKTSYKMAPDGGPAVVIHRTLDVELTVFNGQWGPRTPGSRIPERVSESALEKLIILIEIQRDRKLSLSTPSS